MVEMERESTSETRGVIKQIRIDDAPGVWSIRFVIS
jgi:hypothetical protein